jgi:hypothetical protein
MSEAKCETGWGDLSTRALLDVERPSPHPAAHFMSVDPRASFARLGPLQGRVRDGRRHLLANLARIYAPLSILP